MSLPQSIGFDIVAAAIGAIRAEPALAALPLVRNPRYPQQLDQGPRVIVVTELADTRVGGSGNGERRRRSVNLGALCRGDAADAAADGLYQLLSSTTHAALQAMFQAGSVVQLAERERRFEVEGLEVDGAIVIGGWDIDYQQRRAR